MRGTFAPPAEHYSPELKDLILNLLQLDPDMRPNANQLMAKPLVMNTTLLLLDIGCIECKPRSVPRQAIPRDSGYIILALLNRWLIVWKLLTHSRY